MRIGHGQSFGVIGPFFHLAPLIFMINFFTFLVEFWIATHILCNMMRIGHGQSFRVIGTFFHLAPLIFLMDYLVVS